MNYLKIARQAAEDSWQTIQEQLKGTAHHGAILPLKGLYERIFTRFDLMDGAKTGEEIPSQEVGGEDKFPPIKKFMGREINPSKPIRLADTEVKASDKEIFIGKVQKLWDDFPILGNEAIMNAYSLNKEEAVVLRGVAKKAGIEDYENAKITTKFINAIREGIKVKTAGKDATAKAKKNAARGKTEEKAGKTDEENK